MTRKTHYCGYCDEQIKGKAIWEKKVGGWVCEDCKEILDKENDKK